MQITRSLLSSMVEVPREADTGKPIAIPLPAITLLTSYSYATTPNTHAPTCR